jgi:hypothetical protein
VIDPRKNMGEPLVISNGMYRDEGNICFRPSFKWKERSTIKITGEEKVDHLGAAIPLGRQCLDIPGNANLLIGAFCTTNNNSRVCDQAGKVTGIAASTSIFWELHTCGGWNEP